MTQRTFTVEWAHCDVCHEYGASVEAMEVRVLRPGVEQCATPLVICRVCHVRMGRAFDLEEQADAILGAAGTAAMQRARAA